MGFSFSPFKVKVLPTYDASKVTASGPGLSSYGIPASLPVEFAVDAKDAGQGLLTVQITVSNCKVVQDTSALVILCTIFGSQLTLHSANYPNEISTDSYKIAEMMEFEMETGFCQCGSARPDL